MAITATAVIKHDQIALVPTLQLLNGIQIRVISQENTAPGGTEFPFLVEYDDREELETAFNRDPTIASYSLIDWTDKTGIYYIEHTPETKLISNVVTDVNGFLIHTETKGEGWFVRLLLPDREALHDIWEYTNENNISLNIIKIYGNDGAGMDSSYGLTDEQKIALQTAYEEGYFSEPRDISLDEAASKMDLSSTAMSGRLRRGIRNLVAATIAESNQEVE